MKLTHLICAAAACAALASGSVLRAESALPSLGGAGEWNLAQERQLGDSIAAQLWRDPDLLDDPLLQSYVDGIVAAVVQAARERGDIDADMAERFAWHAFIGKDRTVNAFALPGGYFGVHAGLLKLTQSRDEFASVMAHEVSHVTQRHISRSITKQGQQQPLVLAATLLGILAASRSNSPDALQATAMSSQAASAQLQLNYSRDMEREADRVGLSVLQQAGFEPQGMKLMFERLQIATRLVDSGQYPYLRSHPLNTERIADVQSRIQLEDTSNAGPRAVRTTTTPSQRVSHASIGPLMHTLMSARAKVLADNSIDQLNLFATEAQAADQLGGDKKIAALYAGMLALHKRREFAAAWVVHGKLVPLVAEHPAERLALQISANELARDETIAAGPKATWQTAVQLAEPRSTWRPAVMAWAATQVSAGQATAASDRLQTWVSDHPNDGYAWRLLGKAWEAQNRPLRAIEAVATAHKLEFDFKGALDRLQGAQRQVRTSPADHVDASIIDTKVREIQALLRPQQPQRGPQPPPGGPQRGPQPGGPGPGGPGG